MLSRLLFTSKESKNFQLGSPWLPFQKAHRVAQFNPKAYARLFPLSIDPTDIPTTQETPYIIAVGSGKGGVGKSLISANLAVKFAQGGYRTLVIDVDFGAANLHTYFGLKAPKSCLVHFIKTPQSSLKNYLIKTSINRLSLIAGGKDEVWTQETGFAEQELAKVWMAIYTSKLKYSFDIVIFDLGAGIHANTLDFFTFSDLGILAMLPEPTSIENAYAFLRASLMTLVNYSAKQLHQQPVAPKIISELSKEKLVKFSLHAYPQKLRGLSKIYPEVIENTLKNLKKKSIGIILNQTRNPRDQAIGESIESVCNKFFGLQTFLLANLKYDDVVWKSLRNRRLLVKDFPYSDVSKAIHQAFVLLDNYLKK